MPRRHPVLAVLALTSLLLAACSSAPPAASTAEAPPEASGDQVLSSAAQLRRAATHITQDLAAAFPRDEGLKVAVMPFTEMDGVSVNYLGYYLSEKVTNELVNAAPNLDVLERSRIEEVLGELELGMSGLLDDASVQEAGRALGADAIVVGSLAVIGRRDLPGSEIEANVRGISVGLMKAVTSTSYALKPDAAIWDMMDRRMSGEVFRRASGAPATTATSRGGVFRDDFEPSTGTYRFHCNPQSKRGMGKYLFNDSAGRLEVRNGDNTSLYLDGNLPARTKSGSITVTFYPTKIYPTSGTVGIAVKSTRGDGYAFMFPKSKYKTNIWYLVGGKQELIWDRKGDSFGLNQEHTMTLAFSPERLVVTFDGVKVFDVRNEHDVEVETFTVMTGQIDCYIESIEVQ